MGANLRFPILLICLSLLIQDIFGFVIDRPAREADELTEALRIIQRAKRRLVDDDIESEKGYYWIDRLGLNSDSEMEEADDNQTLRDLFEEGPEEGVLEEDVKEPQIEEEEVDRNELEDLFGDKEEDEMSAKEVEEMLDEEHEIETSQGPLDKEEIKQVVEVSEPNGDGTNTVKIHEDNWLVTPEKTLHNSREDTKEIPVNQEQLEDVEDHPTNTKRKRSDDRVLAEEYAREPEEDDEDQDEGVDLSYIKKFIELEDEENTNLANALNLATRSQVERTDKYIPLEVQYLKESIKDEETIQAIKEQLGIGEVEEDEDEEEEEEEEEEDEEEDDQDVLLEDEIFLPTSETIEDDVPVVEDEDEEDEQDEIHRILSQHLKQFLLRTDTVRQNDVDETDDEDDDVGQWLTAPVRPDETENEKQELNPFLRELLNKLYRSQVPAKRDMRKFRLGEGFREEPQIEEEGEEEADEEEEQDEKEVRNEITSLIEALEEQSEEEELAVEEDTCPSVAEYTDNCAYVRELGMSLDEEALELCNRHQLCYTCGAYHNMNAVICDRGFLNEADRLCRGDATCKDEAAGLFFFMLRDRVFTDIESTGFACAAKCTFEFITGISGA